SGIDHVSSGVDRRSCRPDRRGGEELRQADRRGVAYDLALGGAGGKLLRAASTRRGGAPPLREAARRAREWRGCRCRDSAARKRLDPEAPYRDAAGRRRGGAV